MTVHALIRTNNFFLFRQAFVDMQTTSSAAVKSFAGFEVDFYAYMTMFCFLLFVDLPPITSRNSKTYINSYSIL